MNLARATGSVAVAAVALLSGAAIPTVQPASDSEPFEVAEATILQLQEAISAGRVTSAELVDAYLARIAAYDQKGPRLNAMIRLNPNARAVAETLDRERADSGPRGPLHGVPIILKDNYDTADMPTTGGSIALAGLVPPDDGFQVRRLREAGAVILGKSNLHELAHGVTSISSLGGQTRNPYDPSRNPGGSSGGTGAAVTASFAAIGMGSDTCGSIRIPSAHNNLVGLRPTKGLSSIDGIIPLSHTQDTGGPLARTITDLAIVLDATVGRDPADQATEILEGRSLDRFADVLDARALEGARLGVLTNLFGGTTEEEEVSEIVRAAIAEMETLGAKVVEVTIPEFDDLLQDAGVIEHEFKFDLIDYLAATPGAPVGSLTDILERGLYHVALERNFRRRVEAERDSQEYVAALAKRPVIRESIVTILDDYLLDALVYPTLKNQPATIGERQRGSTCLLSAASGLPALSVPAGFTAAGLPVGAELLGRPLGDSQLVALGYAFEQGTDHRLAPALTPPLHEGRSPRPETISVSVAAETGAALKSTLTFDPTRSLLAYEVALSGVPPAEVHAVSLHRGTDGGTGPVIHRLVGPSVTERSGTLVLSPPDRLALVEGRLYLDAYTSTQPAGSMRAPLRLPADR